MKDFIIVIILMFEGYCIVKYIDVIFEENIFGVSLNIFV